MACSPLHNYKGQLEDGRLTGENDVLASVCVW